MAIKIKKKKPEDLGEEIIEQPDQVLAATQETFGWLQENRNLVLGAIGGLIVAIIVASLAWDARNAGIVSDAAPIRDAIAVSGAGIGGENGAFATADARAEAVLAAAGDNASPVAKMVTGNAHLVLGDAAAARTDFEAAAAAVRGPEQGVLAFGTAAAQAEAGDLAAALATLDAIGSGDDALAPLAALQAARLVDAFDSDEAALDAYRGYLAAHEAGPARADVENRVAQIEIALGVEPVVSDDAAGDEG